MLELLKMKRGELAGFQGCLGYDYNKEDKTIAVNEKAQEILNRRNKNRGHIGDGIIKFESIVEKVIVGGYDEDGNKDPAQLKFFLL